MKAFFGKNIAIVIVLFSYTGFLNTCLCTFNSDYESRIIISAPQDKKSAADGLTAQRSTWALLWKWYYLCTVQKAMTNHRT